MEKKRRSAVRPKDYVADEISLWLDGYDDIFSDFDPRPYSHRNISEDFLYELNRISQENNPVNRIKLLVPGRMRKSHNEAIIQKRLHQHLKNTLAIHEAKIRSLRLRSFLFISCGMIMMLCASYLVQQESTGFIRRLLRVITEPGGWFLMWTGLDTLINIGRRVKRELLFLRKVSKSKIEFESIA